MKLEFKTEVTCPNCAFSLEEEMSIDASPYFYQCESCKEVLRPKEGDCCIYCSYGTHKCPGGQKDDYQRLGN